MKPLNPLLLSVAMCTLLACSQSSESQKTPPKPIASIPSSAPTAPTPEAPEIVAEADAKEAAARGPRSEEALVETVARAVGARDLSALQACATAEFSADLKRMHDADPARFWILGSAFVQNVKTGFEVIHRQEDTRDQWNIVLRFGNGQEERLTFTREDGKILFVDL